MIQFKLEGPIIKRRPEFEMNERLLLDRVDYRNRTIELNGKVHPIENTCFRTVDRRQPTALLEEEQEVMDKLLTSVQESEKLRRHVDFLMKKGTCTYVTMVIYSFTVVFPLTSKVKWKV